MNKEELLKELNDINGFIEYEIDNLGGDKVHCPSSISVMELGQCMQDLVKIMRTMIGEDKKFPINKSGRDWRVDIE